MSIDLPVLDSITFTLQYCRDDRDRRSTKKEPQLDNLFLKLLLEKKIDYLDIEISIFPFT